MQSLWLSSNSIRWKLNNSNQAAACLQRGIRATGGWTLLIFAGLALNKTAVFTSQPAWGEGCGHAWHDGRAQIWRRQIPVWACPGQCVPVLCEDSHSQGREQEADWVGTTQWCSLLARAPPDADNRLVYCTPLAAQPTWPNVVIYGRFPCLISLMFILIHNAEAGLINSEPKVLAANMSQYGQVVFSRVNYIVVLHKWGHRKK